MSDSLQMYRTLVTAFWKQIPRRIFGDIRRLRTLAWAVIALCFTKTANFSKWGEVVIGNAKYAASCERRFKRRSLALITTAITTPTIHCLSPYNSISANSSNYFKSPFH